MTVRRSPEWRKAISDGIRRSTKHNLGTGPGHRRWKGGVLVERGYRWIWLSPEERAKHACKLSRGRYIQEHVAVVEGVLGRCLKRGEVVHHINGDSLDNRKRNLLVCTQSYHMLIHQRMGQAWAREHLSGV